ncbi:hypothetical protein HDR66_00125 [bacterium]|nr:hypothetical protein [bacterium]
MKKQIDRTTGRVGAAMRQARRMCNMEQSDAARFMHMTSSELDECERGTAEIPTGALEHIFALGYQMMQVSAFIKRYRLQRLMLHKIKQSGAFVTE